MLLRQLSTAVSAASSCGNQSRPKDAPTLASLNRHHEVVSRPQVWEGEGVVASFRKLVGATNPLTAEPGTIRGDFGRVTGRNIVHASDSPDNGVREAGAATRLAA